MVVGVLSRPAVAVVGLMAAGPRLLMRGAVPALGAAAGAAAGTARAGVRSADSAVRVVRVVRTSRPRGPRPWRSGTRAHLALRPQRPDPEHADGGREHRVRRVVAALAERPDVDYA